MQGKARVVVKVVTIVNLIRHAIVTGNNLHRKGLALGPGCHTGRHDVERIPPLEHSRNFYAPAPRGARTRGPAESRRKCCLHRVSLGFDCISRTGTNLGPKALREAGDQFLLYNANTGRN
jgi:hypothetical protein